MLNNSFTKTNTIFGQALGCTALDDAFVKRLSDVNADGVTQFLVRTNGEEKMKTVAQINSESLEAGVRERIFDKVSPKSLECSNRCWVLFQICFVQYIQNILSKPASILPFDAWRRCANCRQ